MENKQAVENETEMVDCGVCGRTHENLPQVDCRAFKLCSKCGDGYVTGKYGPLADRLTPHEAQCNGQPSMNVIDESEGSPRTCILTGEPGENPDDCTTHAHEGDVDEDAS